MSSDSAEVVKVALRKYESARTPKQSVIITPNSFMQKKNHVLSISREERFLVDYMKSCICEVDMSCRFPCYDYLAIIANV